MGKLVINHNLVNAENAKTLTELCPFGAISYDGNKLDISSACKMCKLCVKKSSGVITYEELTNYGLQKAPYFPIHMFILRYFAPIAITLIFVNELGWLS